MSAKKPATSAHGSGIRPIRTEHVVNLFKEVAPEQGAATRDLIARLQPRFLLDTQTEAMHFKADSDSRTIAIGLACTCRLEAYAYVAGVVLSALATPNYDSMDPDEREGLWASTDTLLTWAVSNDLQQCYSQRGFDYHIDDIIQGAEPELPEHVLSTLSQPQLHNGQGLFRFASAFIILHELAHLQYGHRPCQGIDSIDQEKEADRFAIDWLSGSEDVGSDDRVTRLLGVSVALLWLTVFNVYMGRKTTDTHPQGYDRLYQGLDHATGEMPQDKTAFVWHFAAHLLFVLMKSRRIEVPPEGMQGSRRDQISYLIDLISKQQS